MKKTIMHYGKRIVAVLTAIMLLVFLVPEEAVAATYVGSGILSNNIHDHAYDNSAIVSNSYLINNGNGTLTRLENFGDVFLVEKYNQAFKLLGQGTLPYELPYFGGFYAGAFYNYLLFGQPNSEKNNQKEVIRIVRYSKDWVRLGSFSLSCINTSMPFTGCNTSFSEYGNLLYIRCGHTDYQGVQSTINITYDNNTGVVTDLLTGDGTSFTGVIPGTQATYIDATSGVVTVCDDVSASPACISMSAYMRPAGPAQYAGNCQYATALGDVGSLYKGTPVVTLGGFAVNTQYAIAVGTTTPMDGTSSSRNVFVMATPFAKFQRGSVEIKYLTGFAYDSMTCSTPYLVNLGNNTYMVLWEQKNGYSDMGKVYYAMIDAAGNRVGDVKNVDGCLSDCQPIVVGTNIVWYTTDASKLRFYTIPIQSGTTTGGTTISATSILNGIDYSAVYDYNYYINAYPDVRLLYTGKPDAALYHFVTQGMKAGRQGCANFSPFAYKNRYADLRAVYGENIEAYYYHFMNFGYTERRNGRP